MLSKRSMFAMLFYAAAAALFVALFAACGAAREQFGRNSLLLAAPSANGSSSVSVSAVEEYRNGTRTQITFEIKRQATASAVRANHRMNVIGTNHIYADVMGYPAADGGFFTKDAFAAGAREAVLNRRAAAALFGGGHISGSPFQLDGELWTIVGVIIDDDADNGNIYVPATSGLINNSDMSTAGSASTPSSSSMSALTDSLMVLLGGYGGMGAAIAANGLRDIGVNEGSYDIKNLGKATGFFNEALVVALRIALALLLGMFAWRSARGGYRVLLRSKAAADNAVKIKADAMSYIASKNPGKINTVADIIARENNNSNSVVIHKKYKSALRKKNRMAFRAVLMMIFAPACAAAVLYLIREIVGMCVSWQEMPLLFISPATVSDAFYGRLSELGDRQFTVMCLFAASVAATAIAVFTQE